MANITIDGKPYAVKDGITIIEAIDQARIDLPRYCYHPGLSIAGNCRICQVEVEKMPRTVIACNTRVAEGMVIRTQSPKAKESQQVVLEFLLANHPLDCPVCDQAGECSLQDYYMDYGVYDPKFDELKVKKTKKAFPIGPTIMLDQERCILCSRCVRFADEITKTSDFGIFNRGDHSELDVYPGRELNNKYSGNVADICPVGALTDRDFRFKMRVWYLGSQDSICPGCSRGCNISIQYEKSRPYHLKEERVMRLKPRDNREVNKWWICDEGRYGYKPIDFNRLKQVNVRKNGAKGESAWLDALEKAAGFLKPDRTRGAWALITSAQYTNEELFLQKKLFKDLLKWSEVGFFAPGQDGYEDDFLLKKDKNPNTSGASQIFKLDGASRDFTPIAEKAKKGQLEGLFIFNQDLAKLYGAEALQAIRKNVKTIIYEGPNENPTAAAADLVLPSASYAEKDGTFTNFEGRVQRIKKALEPLGSSRPTWQILLDLAALLGQTWSYKKPEDIFNDLARENEAFRDLAYKKIGSSGMMWNKK
ncbi:MAG: molybdopterin-dependent oxidoreductase [Candidatus Omnitrophota bacterium]